MRNHRDLRSAVKDEETIVIETGIEVGEEVNLDRRDLSKGSVRWSQQVMPARQRVAVLLEVFGMERKWRSPRTTCCRTSTTLWCRNRRSAMPIYEFYPRTRTGFTVSSARSISQANLVPRCPDDPKARMEKLVSRFAVTRGMSEPDNGEAAEAKEMESVLSEVQREMRSIGDSTPDPQQLGKLMRKCPRHPAGNAGGDGEDDRGARARRRPGETRGGIRRCAGSAWKFRRSLRNSKNAAPHKPAPS